MKAHISHSVLDPSVPVHSSVVFDRFESVSLFCLQELVSHLKPSGSPYDALPPRFFKEVFLTIAPFVQSIVNSSFSSGVVPVNLKHAVIQPLLKKPALDPDIIANYRLISKRPFISKILEKPDYKQLMSFLEEHSILEVFQSGFKALHSTETDVFLVTDSGDCYYRAFRFNGCL